jgi:hypothetical protein
MLAIHGSENYMISHIIPPVVSDAYLPPCFLSIIDQMRCPVFKTLFAAVAAPSCSFSYLPHALLWLLYSMGPRFAVWASYQTLPRSLAEDLLNPPDLPLPAGRISLRTARTLHWTMMVGTT